MANIIIPQRRVWTQQPPQSVEIDWSNPITQGLVLCAPMGVMGQSLQNAVNGKLPTYISLSGRQATSKGLAASFDNSISRYVAFDAPMSSGNMSCLAISTPSSVTGKTLTGIFNIAASSAVGNYLSIESSSAHAAIATDGSNWSLATGSNATTGKTQVVGATFKASGARNLYIDGSYSATQSTARNPISLNKILIGVYYGGSGSGYLSPYYGGLDLVLWWNRELTSAEMCRITENPYQILRRRPRRTIIDFGASSGITISTTPALAVASGLAAQVISDITIPTAIASGTAVASGVSTSVSSGVTISTGIAAASASGLAAGVSSTISISTGIASGAATGPGATISTDSGTINCGMGVGTSSSLTAIVTSDISVSTGIGTAAASGIASTVTTAQSISSSIAAALGSGLGAAVISEITIATGVTPANAIGLAASIVEQEIVLLTQEQLDQALAYIKSNPMILTIPKYIALKDAF